VCLVGYLKVNLLFVYKLKRWTRVHMVVGWNPSPFTLLWFETVNS